jgi:hypothetical protein
MTKYIRLTVILVLLCVAFGAGALTAISRGWGNGGVNLEVVNRSGLLIRSFVAHYNTCGFKGSIVGGELAAGRSKNINFTICGEAGYFVEVEFIDGRKLKGSEGYVESGSFLSEEVSQNDIRPR